MRCTNPRVIKVKFNDPNDIYIVNDRYVFGHTVNCGKCYNCLKNRALAWNYRLEVESNHYQNSKCCMVTLTLQDHNIPRTKDGVMTLSHRHVQDFIKRLRYYEKQSGNKRDIRYFCVGEYGGKTRRPHHHIIFFNVISHNNIVKAYQEEQYRVKRLLNHIIEKSKNGQPRKTYTPNKHGVYGRLTIDELTDGTRKYVANYMVKERWTKRPKDVKREYTACSIGIGYQKLMDKEFVNHYLHNPQNTTVTTKEGFVMPLPRYYRNKIFTADERRLLYYEFLYSEYRYKYQPTKTEHIAGFAKLKSISHLRDTNQFLC